MSAAKQILLALSVAYAAAAESLSQQANEMDDGGGAAPAAAPAKGKGANAPAPAPRAAVGKGGKKGKAAAPTVDFDTLKTKLLDHVVKEISKDAAVACLDRFGAKKLGDLTEDQYAEFDAYLDSVVSGEVDPLAAEDAAGTGEEDLL